ncbi:MAG TPA: cytochrome c [Usitatibacter sp.]|nr:cytochrome c [Usitatibacter sp.]
MNKRNIAIAALAAAISTGAMAQTPKPEDQIRLRKAAYDLMSYGFASIDAMNEGKKPYSRDEAVRSAELMVQMSTLPRLFFGEGTDKGETRAKPEIWTHRADFDAKMDKMISEVGKVAAAARSGDPAALRSAADAAGDACKACHDDYRQKRR